MITKVTGKNQVTIPAKLARELSIVPGTELEWSRAEEEATIRIRVRPSTDQILLRIQEMAAPYRAKAKEMLEDLQRMRDEDDPEYSAEEGQAR